jgi:hypothetical protein
MADTSGFFSRNATNILLGLGAVIIVVLVVLVGLNPINKDNANEIRKTLAIIGGVAGILCLILAIASYMYFTSYPAYLTNFILIMTFLNLGLSIFATSAATVNISNV